MMLGRNVTRGALHSDLAASGRHGEEMHLALASPLGKPDAMGRVKVRASVEAFDSLTAWCERNCSVDPGADRDSVARAASALRTLKRLRASMAKLAKHPGYRGVAMVGVVPVRLPAARCGEGRWWPTRRLALAHSDGTTSGVVSGFLEPQVVRRQGRVFTAWELSEAGAPE